MKPQYAKRNKVIKEADLKMSRFIRMRDCLWTTKNSEVGVCISCGGRCMRYYSEDVHPTVCGTAGHFVPRGNMALRWDMENVNLQCRQCNEFLKGNLDGYREGIIAKYGKGALERLEGMRMINQKWSTVELVELGDFFHEALIQVKKRFKVNT